MEEGLIIVIGAIALTCLMLYFLNKSFKGMQ